MKVRRKGSETVCHSGSFNMASLTEIFVDYAYDDGTWEHITDYRSNYDVLLPDGTWKDLVQAFRDHDVVPNNENSRFGYPMDEECRRRGYNP